MMKKLNRHSEDAPLRALAQMGVRLLLSTIRYYLCSVHTAAKTKGVYTVLDVSSA